MDTLSTVDQQSIEAAHAALDRGDVAQARREAERVAASAPEHPATLLLLAELAHHEGNAEEACARYEQCLALPLDEESAWLAHANLAELLVESGQGQKALRHARAAIELDPEELDPYLAAARAHRLLGQPGNAIRWLNEALGDEESHLDALILRAELYTAQGNPGKALSDYASAIDLDPAQGALYLAVAEAALAIRDQALALNTLEEGLDALPPVEQRPLREARARLLLQVGESERGLQALDELLAEEPDSDELRLLRAETYLDLDEAEQAMTDFDVLLGRKPDWLEALSGKADALVALERAPEARPLLDRITALDPSADSYNQRGDLLFMLDDLPAARADYEQALVLDARHPLAAYNLALTLIALGEAEAALPYLDQAVELAPRDEERLRSRSELLRQTGHPHLAWLDADRALEIDGDYIEAYLTRAEASIELEAYDEALHDLEIALELYPDYGAVIATRARLLAQLDDPHRAREEWQRYTELPEGEQEPELLIEARQILGNNKK